MAKPVKPSGIIPDRPTFANRKPRRSHPKPRKRTRHI